MLLLLGSNLVGVGGVLLLGVLVLALGLCRLLVLGASLRSLVLALGLCRLLGIRLLLLAGKLGLDLLLRRLGLLALDLLLFHGVGGGGDGAGGTEGEAAILAALEELDDGPDEGDDEENPVRV